MVPQIPLHLRPGGKAVKFEPINVKDGDSFAVQLLVATENQPAGGANNDKKRLGGNDHVIYIYICQKWDSPGLFQHFELKSRALKGP